jgi:hypothetical protein
MRKLTVGCDPEVFLFDRDNGLIIPACGLIGGTKKQPLGIGGGVYVQEDNVTVEFNIDPVDHEYGSDALFDTARGAYNSVTYFVRAKHPGYSLSIASSHKFRQDQLQSEQAQMFGCDPDLNAYRHGSQNPLVEPSDVGPIRCAGGHIHFGYPKNEVQAPETALVQLLEGMVLFHYAAQTPEYIGTDRVKFYGKPGAFRKKPYGFEWRTPSNMWLQHRGFAKRACDFMLWAINNETECRVLYDRIDFAEVERQLADPHKMSGQMMTYLDGVYDKYVKIPSKSGKKGETGLIDFGREEPNDAAVAAVNRVRARVQAAAAQVRPR